MPGVPGALPVVNGKAVESAIRIGLALNCSIAPWGRFARKNYFYPDMPKNYQISQYDEPIAVDGWLDVTLDDGEVVRVEIERAHMEEDTGKSLHVGGATGRIHGADYSLVDYNRAGIPLIEIVTKPIVGTGKYAPQVARAYVAHLRELVKALGVSDARMEQGSMRCDVNLSLMPRAPTARHPSETRTSTPCARWSARCATRSSATQASLDAGQKIVQETRHWHEDTGVTTPAREVRRRGLPLLPRARPGPGRPLGGGMTSSARACPSRRHSAARACRGVGYSDLEMRDFVARCARPHRGDRSPPARPRRRPQVGSVSCASCELHGHA